MTEESRFIPMFDFGLVKVVYVGRTKTLENYDQSVWKLFFVGKCLKILEFTT